MISIIGFISVSSVSELVAMQEETKKKSLRHKAPMPKEAARDLQEPLVV